MRKAFIFLVGSLSCLLLGLLEGQSQQKPKWPPSPHIAATDPLRPEEQIKKLKLPPGFELQLVAADPDIRKPINIAFDAAGRLWLTETVEYPYAAPEGKGRDAVKILEDFGPDGRARKITTFVDKLNIPIGLLPTAKGALVYSIPAIYHMIDAKGIGKADVRQPLYTGYGHQDTHGMSGEFQEGFDGWIYCCHGFSNTSHVKSRGDTAITMQSGNTYRIKPDGSRIEYYTHGQVNPFGMTFDPAGNLYDADCHSRPLTQLLRGAWYESFGKPSDGLGFAPHMNGFEGHSTALCGVSYYAADQYPKEYQGMLFLGDVVLNRLNAYRLEWSGSSPRAIMQPFITSSDPWFRPVDIKLGPDGCLYFADFYNRIIGHYEVALNHPGRDRDKGRIWRIVYRGKDGKSGPLPVKNLAKADVSELIAALASPNLTVRLHATHQLVERSGADTVRMVSNLLDKENASADQQVHALWVLQRLGKIDMAKLQHAAVDPQRVLRIHAQRILTEDRTWDKQRKSLAEAGLKDQDALVQRSAAEALASHPSPDQVRPLLDLRHRVLPADTHLLYAVRLALRNQLRGIESWKNSALKMEKWNEKDRRAIADVCLGIRDEPSAEFLKTYLTLYDDALDRTRTYAHYIVRYGSADSLTWMIDFLHHKQKHDLAFQGTILKAAVQAAQERGKMALADPSGAAAIVQRLLSSTNPSDEQTGAEIAGTMRLAGVQPMLFALVERDKIPAQVRKASIAALLAIDAKKSLPPLTLMLLNEKEAISVREEVASALAGLNQPSVFAALVSALQGAPARLQHVIALGMAGSGPGGDKLLQAIEAGKASPRLLQDRAIDLRLRQAKIADGLARLKKLTEGLPPADQKAQALIAKRRESFVGTKADVEAGQKVFQKQCANCHQIAGQGAKIGPQLDGIGIRGLERLLEDVLDPNRNVDQAFRTTVLTLKNGQVVSGLFQREEGNVVILADAQGKEQRVEKEQIEERALSPLSPMPSNFAEQITESDFQDLMSYLLRQRGKS